MRVYPMFSVHAPALMYQVQQHEGREVDGPPGHRGLRGLRGPGGGRDLGHPGSIPSAEGGLTALVRKDWRTKGRESRWDEFRRTWTGNRMWLIALMMGQT